MKEIPTPKELAEMLLSVQPMDKACEAFNTLYKTAKSEEWLKKNGYEPICENTRLMWIKKK